MRFQIGEAIYEARTLDRLSLLLNLELQKETARLGLDRQITMGSMQQMQARLAQLPEEERALDPDSTWVIAVSVWASRRQAGEQLSFEAAIDFPMSDLKWLPDPTDRLPPKNPTKARPAPRKASGAGAGRRSAAKAPAPRTT